MLEPGTEIAGYRIEGVLGQGGMGVVYEATQVTLGRRVALKLLVADLGSDPSFSERFRHEGRAQAALDHPHIVTVFEAGETDGRPFLAMRLVRGRTLRQMILQDGLDAPRVLRILGPIADALDTAHAAGLIHRDIKPQNILVDQRDHPYLADFGITKGVGQTDLTRAGHFLGTIDYIAPEAIRGRATRASDIYSLAAVLFECLTGEPPYRRPSDVAVLFAHDNAPTPAVTDVRPDLPDALDGVIARGLAKDPADRHPSAAALILDAGRALGRHITVAPPVDAFAEGGHPAPLGREQDPRYTPTTPELVSAEVAATPTVPAPPTRASPDTPITNRRRVAPKPRVRNVAAAAGLVVLVTAALGFVVGHSGTRAPRLSATADGGTVAVSVPGDWRPVASDGAKLGLRHGYTTRSPDRRTGVTLGESSASGTSLLPEQLRRGGAGSRAEPGHAVQLDRLLALRYDDVDAPALGAGRRAVVYALPTSRGVATIVCAGPRPDALAETCDRIAETAQLRRGQPRPLAPDKAYGTSVDSALAALRSARARGATRLRAAGTSVAQAKALTALAGTYRSHEGALNRIAPGPQERSAHQRLARGARAAADAYAALASAARRGDRAAYRRARRDVAAAEDQQRQGRAALRDLGYPLGA